MRATIENVNREFRALSFIGPIGVNTGVER